MYEPTVEQSTMHLIVDQLEELLVTIIDEIRQRPSVALDLRPHALEEFLAFEEQRSDGVGIGHVVVGVSVHLSLASLSGGWPCRAAG